ncbi:hypothetical protein HMI54_005952 [Coelomomyces lativittatus]|nr:hypothetical protein HMI56_002684 [Coelomomyces lativittatus]KAJ1504497.1 hypothetical protein HMI55_001983 [Coelomomyces lativittatus]KAJ1505417.1 hypothetical protein HMI54_005952 [Coelomomyces lativittatus]
MPMLLDSDTLNDYISPAIECTIPLFRNIKPASPNVTSVHLNESTNTYYEVTKEGDMSNLKETNAITLNDCLACTGCISSAELILVQQQNHTQFLAYLDSRKQLDSSPPPIYMSLSRESLAALATRYNVSLMSAARKVTWFAKHHLEVSRVIDLAVFNRIALLEVAEEFKTKLETWKTQSTSSTSSSVSLYPFKSNISPTPFTPSTSSTTTTTSSFPFSPKKKRVTTAQLLRHRDFTNQLFPLLCSSCPGWICYVEKEHPELVPLLSHVPSPQQVSGILLKKCFPNCYYITVMPCLDKKLEAIRPEFVDPITHHHYVDSVLSTQDLEHLFHHIEPTLSFSEFPETEPLDPYFASPSATHLTASPNSTSGGYLSHLLIQAPRLLQVPEKDLRLEISGHVDFEEYTLLYQGTSALRFAAVYGFKHIQTFLRKLTTDRAHYHYVEIMACPRGCVNGGGQGPMAPLYVTSKAWVSAMEAAYYQAPLSSLTTTTTAHCLPLSTLPSYDEQQLLNAFKTMVSGLPGSTAALKLLRTSFRPLSTSENLNGSPDSPTPHLNNLNSNIPLKSVLSLQDALW